MAFNLVKQTRFARVYKDKATHKGIMKATVAPMNYESVQGSGHYDTPIDLENVATDDSSINGYVMNGAAYQTQIQTAVETGAQQAQGTMTYTFNGHSISFLFADMAYLRTDTRAVTPFGGGLDYTASPGAILDESTRDLGSHASVTSDVITCSSDITWYNLQVHDSESPELSHAHHGERYKILVKTNNAYRNWTDANDPPAQETDTLAGCLFEVDWSDIPHVYLADGTEVDPLLDDFTDAAIGNDIGGIYLRDAGGGLIGFMPNLGIAYSQESWRPGPVDNSMTTRFWTDGGTSYMYKGIDAADWAPGAADYSILTMIYTRDELVPYDANGQFPLSFMGNDVQGHYYEPNGYYYTYTKPIGATIGTYGADYQGMNGFRFESPVPRGASLSEGSEYATLQLYASTNFSFDVAVPMDAWTDVQVPDGPRFRGHDYIGYDYTVAPISSPFATAPNWTDSAVYTTTELNTPERTLNSDDLFEGIDISAQMEESISVDNWREENGLRIRLQDNPAANLTVHTAICSYEARTGIAPALNVEFTFPRRSPIRDIIRYITRTITRALIG